MTPPGATLRTPLHRSDVVSISRLGGLSVLSILIVVPAVGGQFRHGLGRGDSINAKLPNLPAVRIGRASLAIEVKDATAPAGQPGMMMPVPGASGPGDTTVPVTQLQAALDQAFRESFTLVQSNGDAFLRVAITHYTPAESRIDTLTRKARTPAPPNPDGTVQRDQTGQPLMIDQTINVEQWVAKGQLAVRVEVVDSSGVLLDGFAPQSAVSATQVISVNGQDRVDRTQIPTLDQVKAKLIADLVKQFVLRYAPVAEAVEIPLAVDEELRPGNKLAKEGDFESAVKSWQAAVLKKGENEADKAYNLGAVYETEAYDRLLKQGAVDQILPYLERATKQYAADAAADPKEKYFTRATERLRKARLRLNRIADLEAVRQRTLTAKATPSPWPPGSPPAAPVAQMVLPPQAAPFIAQPVPAETVPAAVPTPVPAPVVVTAPTPAPDAVVVNKLMPAAVQPAVAPAEAVPAPAPPAPATPPADPALQEAMEQALNDPRPDSAQEKVFRTFIRLRLKALSVAVTDDAKRQLEAIGPAAYSLSALQSRRVVHQEAKAWTALQPKLAIYRESVAAFAADGKLSTEERAALQALGKQLGLAAEDVAAIEGAFKVQE